MIRYTASASPSLATRWEAEGFRPGAPEGSCHGRVDMAICLTLRCPHCRTLGMLWRPYTDGKRYRGIIVCPVCWYQEEG